MQTLNDEKATRLAGENPDYGIQLLFNTIESGIESGKFPSWTVYIVRVVIHQLHTLTRCDSKL